MGLLLFLSYILFVYKADPTVSPVVDTKITPTPSPLTKKYGLPVRLQIPKINVDVPILYLGLTSDGDMDVPSGVNDVGWYKYGPHPGDKGSAVIAGHLEGVKERGVFIDLDTLQKGDTLLIIDDQAAVTTFVVQKAVKYGQDERPSEVFQTEGDARLNLITCTGIWSNAQQRYSHRLVVFANKAT